MRLLIVEDSQARIDWFINEFREHSLTIVKTAKEAIELVTKYKFDVIFLDHDLEDVHYKSLLDYGVACKEGTGYEVAKHIKNSINDAVPVIVHSMNYAGTENIKSVLANAIHIPFGMFDKSIIIKKK
jgi:CheY-like chemotaxis protein